MTSLEQLRLAELSGEKGNENGHKKVIGLYFTLATKVKNGQNPNISDFSFQLKIIL